MRQTDGVSLCMDPLHGGVFPNIHTSGYIWKTVPKAGFLSGPDKAETEEHS